MNEFTPTLSGQSVLVTRPQERCNGLIRALLRQGACVNCIPLLHLQPVPISLPPNPGMELPALVFVSSAAVRYGLPPVAKLLQQRLKTCTIYAVGQATQASLSAQGLHAQIPESATSEGLLALPGFLQHPLVWIIRGLGGRTLLAEALRQHGATVHYIEVYQRQVPEHAAAAISQLLLTTPPHWVILASLDTALQWKNCAGPFWNTPQLLVVSTRIQNHLLALGARRVYSADTVADEDLVSALQHYHCMQHQCLPTNVEH